MPSGLSRLGHFPGSSSSGQPKQNTQKVPFKSKAPELRRRHYHSDRTFFIRSVIPGKGRMNILIFVGNSGVRSTQPFHSRLG